MSTYFTGMLLVYIFHCILFSSDTLYIGTSNCLMSTYFTGMLLVYIFTEYYLFFWYIICRNVLLLYVYLFHDQLFLISRTLYVGASYCCMSTISLTCV